jgi:hypothetical protein
MRRKRSGLSDKALGGAPRVDQKEHLLSARTAHFQISTHRSSGEEWKDEVENLDGD